MLYAQAFWNRLEPFTEKRIGGESSADGFSAAFSIIFH
jgi:hypothetical protein